MFREQVWSNSKGHTFKLSKAKVLEQLPTLLHKTAQKQINYKAAYESSHTLLIDVQEEGKQVIFIPSLLNN